MICKQKNHIGDFSKPNSLLFAHLRFQFSVQWLTQYIVLYVSPVNRKVLSTETATSALQLKNDGKLEMHVTEKKYLKNDQWN